jgi:uncharacterized repeat protein (TIGR01451 family)
MVKFLIIILLINNLYGDELKYLKRTIVDETSFESASNEIADPSNNAPKEVNIGFDFPFNGSTFNKVKISSNGVLDLGNNGKFGDNKKLPYKNNSIYPYWDKLRYNKLPPSKISKIKYETKGNGSNRYLVVSWEDVKPKSIFSYMTSTLSFQAILYQDGSIRFRYDENAKGLICFFIMFCSGSTIGVEESNNRYDQYSYNQKIDTSKDVLYIPIRGVKKDSCVINDPYNQTTNPKRIPGATIRYAINVYNFSSSNMTDVIVEDKLSSIFNLKSIKYLQIQNGLCDCLGVTSANNNGANGSSDGVNPVKLDFETINANSQKCGYFEVNIK